MRKYSLGYFLSQGFKGFWRNRVMSFASVTVLMSCLVVIGSFALLVYNINLNMESMNGLNEIVAFVEPAAEYESGDNLRLPPAVPAKDARLSFLGWSTDPDADAPEYEAGQVYTAKNADAIGDSITMYAIWSNVPTRDGIRILYNANGCDLSGELPSDGNLYQVGDSFDLPAGPEPRFVNVSFYGWSLTPEPEDDSKIRKADEPFVIYESDVHGGKITLYAVWSETSTVSSYHVVYDMNGVEVADDNVPTAEKVRLTNIRAQIENLENVDTVSLVTKEEALAEELENLKDYPDLVASLQGAENFYPDAFHVTYFENASVDTLEYHLSNIDGIYKVNCRADVAETIEKIRNEIILIFVWFMVILFIISIFIIINTVKLSVYARRQEVSIMRYVGATRTFISMPFIIEGTIIGLLSAGIAYFIQQLLYTRVQKVLLADFNLFTLVSFSEVWKYLLAGFFLIGILCGVIGSMISLRKYMNK